MSTAPEDVQPPEEIPGVPRTYKYSEPPLQLTDEEREHYDKIHAEIVAKLKQQKGGRRSRWQPPT